MGLPLRQRRLGPGDMLDSPDRQPETGPDNAKSVVLRAARDLACEIDFAKAPVLTLGRRKIKKSGCQHGSAGEDQICFRLGRFLDDRFERAVLIEGDDTEKFRLFAFTHQQGIVVVDELLEVSAIQQVVGIGDEEGRLQMGSGAGESR